ncbi:uncharacterized protein DS421_18g630160 [Arachis hypogaea]|nr:uncharacterized protein DS421_18g630160 [Arachis hypogaea]
MIATAVPSRRQRKVATAINPALMRETRTRERKGSLPPYHHITEPPLIGFGSIRSCRRQGFHFRLDPPSLILPGPPPLLETTPGADRQHHQNPPISPLYHYGLPLQFLFWGELPPTAPLSV